MDFTIEIGNLRGGRVVDGGILPGTFNFRKAGILVRRSGITSFTDIQEKHFYTTLVHGRLAVYLGKKEVRESGLVVYGFEDIGTTLEDFQPSNKEFALVQSVFKQILEAIVVVHDRGFEIDSIDKLSSYLFIKDDSTVTVKLRPHLCRLIVSDPAKKKRDNMKSFGRLLSSFFFGQHVDVAAVFNYDPVLNEPPISHVPCINEKGFTVMLFTYEVVHAVKSAMDPPRCDSPAVGMVEKPLFWSSGERLDFQQDGWESIKHLHSLHDVVVRINSMEGFYEAVGFDWGKLDYKVKMDLIFNPTSQGSASQGRVGQNTKFVPDLFTPCDMLRCIRNLKAHSFKIPGYKGLLGASIYRKYDFSSDVEAGFDVLMSMNLPKFLITVYEALVEARVEDREKKGQPIDRTLDRYLKYAHVPRPT